jgi:hypothetical protein
MSAVLLYVAPMIGSYRPHLGPFPYTEFPALSALPELVQAGDAVLFTDIAWYGIHDLFDLTQAPAYVVHYVGVHSFMDEAERAMDVVLPSLSRARRVWVVSNEPERVEPELLLMERLTAVFPLRQVIALRDDTIIRRYGPGASESRAIDALLGGAFLFKTASLPPDASAGVALTVVLSWELVAASAANYSVFVHLRDASERTVAQGDGWPRLGTRPKARVRPSASF